MTFFHPSSGEVRAKGVKSCPNSVLHPWLKEELSKALAQLPPTKCPTDPAPDSPTMGTVV
jgi:hypothetical protein